MASLSSLNFRLTANIAPFRKGLNKAERSMDKMGRKMQQTGKNLSMKLTAPLVALGAVSFNVFKGFEAEMSKVKAVSGATAEEFKALSDNAKDLGASTMFTAREVAQLQTEFAKLGFTATEITKVTESTLALAQASGSDLARAAEVAGSTLRAFGLDANETGRVTDVMATSFSSSALDMETFANSMAFVAPVAKSAGMSIEETSAMLAVLANAGIKGSKAGTALRRIISEIGATGKPVSEALKDLATQGIGLADAKDEVGRSAQSALLILSEGVDQIKPLTTEFENSAGAAKAMADVMGDNALGASKRLESAMEGLGISIGEILAEGIVPMIEKLAKLAGKLNKMSPSAKRTAVVFGLILAAIGPLMFLIGGLIRNFVLLRAVMIKSNITTKTATALQRVYNMVLRANPIGLVITAVVALAAAFTLLNRKKKEAVVVEKKLTEGAREDIAKTKVRQSQANKLIETIKDQNISNEQRQRLIKRLNTEYKDFLPNLIDEKDSVEDITKAQKEMNNQMAKKVVMIAAQDQLAEASKKAVEAMKQMEPAQNRLDDAMIAYKNSTGETITAQEALRISTTEFSNPYRHLAQEISNANSEFKTQEAIVEGSQREMARFAERIDEVTEALTGAGDETGGLGDETEVLKEALLDLPVKGISSQFEEKFLPMMENVRHQMVNFTALAIQAGRAVSDIFAQSLRDAFGELEKGETRFGKFKESMAKMLRDMIIQFTAAAIAAFALAVAVRLAIGGVGGLGGIGDIFSTMQSVGGFMPNIPMLAEGGVVTSPTLAMIGEGGQSEAVIPLDRLGEFGGGQNVVVTGRISGSDILLSNERASRNRTRQRGF